MTAASARQTELQVEQRRSELVEAALHTLAQLGYARTSLREIAGNSDFTHGVVHYYFKNKAALITECVARYKADCATRYDEIVAEAATSGELIDGVCAAMTATVLADRLYHRMWYDLRNQSCFDEPLQAEVLAIDQLLTDMVWRIVTRYAQLSGGQVIADPSTTYAVVDGIFVHALTRVLAGDDEAPARLEAQLRGSLPLLIH